MTKTKLFTLLTACSLITLNAQAAEISTNSAKLQAMDKITGRVSEIIAPIDTEIKFGSLSIVTRACKTRPPEETPENFAFMDIIDIQPNQDPVNIFKGWMLSSSPALNPVEHPVYDVWLLQCMDSQTGLTPLTAEQLAQRDKLAQNNVEQVAEEIKEEPATQETAQENQADETNATLQEINSQEQENNLNKEDSKAEVSETQNSERTDQNQDVAQSTEDADIDTPKMLINIPDQQITVEEKTDTQASISKEDALQTIEQIKQQTDEAKSPAPQETSVEVPAEEQKVIANPEDVFAADVIDTSSDNEADTEEEIAQPQVPEVEIPEALPQEEIVIPEGFEEESFSFNEEANSQE